MNQTSISNVYQDMMTLSLRQCQWLECRVCRQAIIDERVGGTAVDAAFYGFAAFAVCVCCKQEAPDLHDRNYRARFRRYVRRLERVTAAMKP